jgi:hypothetical protein
VGWKNRMLDVSKTNSDMTASWGAVRRGIARKRMALRDAPSPNIPRGRDFSRFDHDALGIASGT